MTVRLCPSGFREYDARWRLPDQINVAGMRLVGRGLAAQMHHRGAGRDIVVGHDFRSYSADMKDGLVSGLIDGGVRVHDIGLSLSPMAYFARQHLGIGPVAMVTASHNPNGWTGVKMGFSFPLTHGAEEMLNLKRIVFSGRFEPEDAGVVQQVPGVKTAYLNDLLREGPVSRAIRVVCGAGNGTAGAFAPDMLRGLGLEVIERHCTLDHSFPHYNPNPEALEMLEDIGRIVRENRADMGLCFDGDGDRIGVVDAQGDPVSADKLGLVLARHIAQGHPNPHFIADVKSTGLFETDPILRAGGARVDYCQTGHSYIKRRLHDTGATAAFEKSGHFYFNQPFGRGYDCALRAAVILCRCLDQRSDQDLKGLVAELGDSWCSPSLSAQCADEHKYQIIARLTQRFKDMMKADIPFAGRQMTQVLTINGARVLFKDGSWGLVRASSNTPTLVVVCESMISHEDLRVIVAAFTDLLTAEPEVGAYDQGLPD